MKTAVKFVVFGVVLSLGVWGVMHYRSTQEKKGSAAKGAKQGAARIVNVSVDKARVGAVHDEIVITGSLKPKETVEITAKATGRVEQLRWYVGDRVKKGDLIAELEDDEIQQQVKRAQATLAVSRASRDQRQAELRNSRADLDRAATLFKEGLIPRQDFDARQTAYQVVQAQLELSKAQEDQAQAELNELGIRKDQSKVYSPMAGVVAKRYVDEGALVGPSTPLISLVNLDVMVTVASVPEREIANLRVGVAAHVTVDAFGERPFVGRVARIAPVLDAATRSAMVEVEIPNSDSRLRAEMFARMTLDLGTTRQAILIPREALVYRGQQAGVYILQSKRPIFRAVETGTNLGSDVEVVANLDPGTEVISRGASMLTDTDQIRISKPEGENSKDSSREAAPQKANQVAPRDLRNDSRKPNGEQVAHVDGQD